MFNLEDNLPDELVSSGNSWGEKGKIYLFDSFKCKHKIFSSPTFTILSWKYILIEKFVENFLFDLAQVGPSGNNQQINGEDAGVPNVVLHRQMHQQQIHQQLQLIQQQVYNNKSKLHNSRKINEIKIISFCVQGNKNQLHSNVNQIGMGLGNKSPNLQSPPSNLPNTLGMNSMPMSIANNGTQPMTSMQGMHFNQLVKTFI